jgi:hypothetical protein
MLLLNFFQRKTLRWAFRVCGLAALWPGFAWAGAGSVPPEGIELFESKIRPVLVERCYRCHSAQAEKLKGGLRLDSQAGLLQGGEDGPVIVPGAPDKSRLITALEYTDPDLQMPPKGKLPEGQIADFVAWVKAGAPWPEEHVAQPLAKAAGFDWEERRKEHWAWQPIRAPKVPEVHDEDWCRNPVDAFILARLEQNHLQPAPPAVKNALLRRVYFDLIGLQPSPNDLDDFLADSSPGAYEKVVDRLLASPHFGERWARHWLDLVRYAETLGHEFDYPNPNAWRYRDYVIRAFNADVPYDQFVIEHVAGDLLERPRRHPTEGFNESVIGTGFYWLGQRDHSPVDVRQHQAEVIDNQIDVLTKTFLGLTVACARCHDHKFDAIPTQDYYSLYGIFSSSRYAQAAIDRPEALADKVEQLKSLKERLPEAVAPAWIRQASEVARYLRAAQEVDGATNRPVGEVIAEVSQRRQLETNRLQQWVSARHELERIASKKQNSTGSQSSMTNRVVFADFARGGESSLKGWFTDGPAFGSGVARCGDFQVGTAARPVARLVDSPAADSGIISKRLQGALRSPTFTIERRYIHILAAGRDSRINVPVDNFTMIRDPIYGGLKHALNDDRFQWVTVDVEMWKGHRAYLEFSDMTTPDPADESHRGEWGKTGYLAVRQVVFSDQAEAPALEEPEEPARCLLGVPELGQQTVVQAVEAWAGSAKPCLNAEQAALLNWLIEHRLIDGAADAEAARLATRYAEIEATIPDPVRVLAMTDGTGLDEPVFIRGNHHLLGAVAPRGFLEAIAGRDQKPIEHGSGRLELAERMVDPSDPFLARVMVNRVWLHLFGRGIVGTPDNFGVLGERPSHPELLDWLANWYRTEGRWSTKKLIRLLVTSSTYRMSSQPRDSGAEQADPDDALWHRMPVRRLEGEVIRDAVLSLSGKLNPTMFGPPVPVHLTEFMDGRGRPGRSGPLDGNGRRSIYLEVRRNFINPMMRAFDMPVPFSSVGRRTVSNVPAQSLTLLNDPFIVGEARGLARRVLERSGLSPEQRIDQLYQMAFSRTPTATEVEEDLSFLKTQATSYGLAEGSWRNETQVWSDLCHVLLNVKEFVFIE